MQSEWKYLVQILVRNNHLLDNLLDILISSFNSPIHLWSVRRGVMVCNLEFSAQLIHHLIIQIRPIDSNDLNWHTITANQLVLDKLHNHLSGHVRIRSGLNPFGEVVNCYKNKPVSVGRFRFNHANHVNSPT